MNSVDTSSSSNAVALVALVLVYIAVIGFSIYASVRIIRRAGYSGWWVLMGFVPIGNLIMLGFFAFKQWPVLRELEYLRGHAAATGLPGYGQQPPPYNPGLPGH
ncbi:hypothetical protein [Goekera deserti]|uniref:DUF805 domain-containing protein n=1 Tax=Goekera deserti TaxID=2497753 RepID=UPI0018784711|nr:hypothetical protein [Goekera deserti]